MVWPGKKEGDTFLDEALAAVGLTGVETKEESATTYWRPIREHRSTGRDDLKNKIESLTAESFTHIIDHHLHDISVDSLALMEKITERTRNLEKLKTQGLGENHPSLKDSHFLLSQDIERLKSQLAETLLGVEIRSEKLVKMEELTRENFRGFL